MYTTLTLIKRKIVQIKKDFFYYPKNDNRYEMLYSVKDNSSLKNETMLYQKNTLL